MTGPLPGADDVIPEGYFDSGLGDDTTDEGVETVDEGADTAESQGEAHGDVRD